MVLLAFNSHDQRLFQISRRGERLDFVFMLPHVLMHFYAFMQLTLELPPLFFAQPVVEELSYSLHIVFITNASFDFNLR